MRNNYICAHVGMDYGCVCVLWSLDVLNYIKYTGNYNRINYESKIDDRSFNNTIVTDKFTGDDY